MKPSSRIAFSVDEFAKSAGIARTTAYAEIKAGRLVPVKVGRRTLVPADEAMRWLGRLTPSHTPKSATIRNGMAPSPSLKGQTA
jgi:excisionase family DNA binding protein